MKVCVVTCSRAEYGYLYWPMRRIADSDTLTLQLVVTGMHLNPAFGETWRAIEQDGFAIDARVDMTVAGNAVAADTAVAVSKSIAREIDGLTDVLTALAPDILLVLGDRYEILGVVSTALLLQIPVAHIAGGDTSEGAFDESIRHAITKMSHLHFVTNPVSADRVRQMGENPDHIHCVGSPGLDFIHNHDFTSRDQFFADVGLSPREKTVVVTLHPTTVGDQNPVDDAEALCQALDTLGDDVGIILTGANADPGGAAMNAVFAAFAAERANAVYHTSLGQSRYLHALKYGDLCVGNTSSGLYEAPSFGIPTVNIGTRQLGRLKARSVVDCAMNPAAISAAMQAALALPRGQADTLFGDGHASEKIVATLASLDDPRALLQKRFYHV